MTVAEVENRVAQIARMAADDEAAHSAEDSLRDSVLQAIARMGGEAGELAAAALRTSKIDFQRWCA